MRRSTFKANPAKVRAWQRRSRKPINPRNEARAQAKAERVYGPGGGGGDYATLLRHRQCDTCGRGRRPPIQSEGEGKWIIDWERLRLSRPQCQCSHVKHGRGRKVWWEQISQCMACHDVVHGVNGGWGEGVQKLALELAAALAWAASDNSIIPEPPECSRPARSVREILIDLRTAWRETHDARI